MALEDTLGQMKFTINIPLNQPIENNPENTSDAHTEQIIAQNTLNYLAGKLSGMGSYVKKIYNIRAVEAYREAVGDMADLFISLQVKVKPEITSSIAMVRYFKEDTVDSINLAEKIVHRLNKSEWFAKCGCIEEDPVVEINEHTSSMILAICIGNDLLCNYNLDEDRFIERLVEFILYSITDNYDY